MRKVYSILFLLLLVFSNMSAKDQLIIDALKFENKDQQGITVFTGNVKITRIKDVIKSDKMVLYTNPQKPGINVDRKIKKMVATGNVKFKLYHKLKVYTGYGNKVIYEPNKLIYRIIGNGYLEELTENTKIYGESIYLDQKTGKADIEGTVKKPVRFIMNIESKK